MNERTDKHMLVQIQYYRRWKRKDHSGPEVEGSHMIITQKQKM